MKFDINQRVIVLGKPGRVVGKAWWMEKRNDLEGKDRKISGYCVALDTGFYSPDNNMYAKTLVVHSDNMEPEQAQDG